VLLASFSSLTSLQYCLFLTGRSLLYKPFSYKMSYHLSFLHLYPLLCMIICQVLESAAFCIEWGGSLSMINSGVEILVFRSSVRSLVMIMLTLTLTHTKLYSMVFSAMNLIKEARWQILLLSFQQSILGIHLQFMEHSSDKILNLYIFFLIFSSPYPKFSLLPSGHFLWSNISKCARSGYKYNIYVQHNGYVVKDNLLWRKA